MGVVGKRRWLSVGGVLTLAALSAGCSSPALRYLYYRLVPDRVPITGERTVAAPGLEQPVTILFDRFAVPHIRARTERDLAFALGYVHGRDRRFQMESLRLMAAGRIRELVGGLDASGMLMRLEVFSRLIGLPQDADSLLAAATADELALLDAYAAGVNHATASEPRPMEFRLLGVDPEPWTARDSYLALALVSFGLSKNWEHELGRLELAIYQLRTGSTIERALAIWPVRLRLPPHLFGEPISPDPFAHIPAVAPELAAYLDEWATRGEKGEARSASAESRALSVQLAHAPAPWAAFGRGGSHSNNWAMGGAWTGTGRGALGSDPHMPHSMPPLGYLAHLECEPCGGRPFRAIGGGFMGLPGITFGTNGRVAWAATANWADVTDLYVEKPVVGRPGYYQTPGGSERFAVREEVFRIRRADGSFATERRTVRSSRHGPLINDFVARVPDDYPPVALRRQGLVGHPLAGLADLYRSTGVGSARAALGELVAFTGHWVVTDADGHVAYLPAVRLPRRTNQLGTFPVPGWTGTYEWDGFVPFDDLPWVEDPPGGLVASSNNQVADPDAFPVPVNFEGDLPNRYMRVAALLDGGAGASTPVERTRAMQLDGLDAGIPPLLARYAEPLARLGGDPDSLVARAARALAAWDGRHRPESFEPTVWNTLVALLIERTLEDEMSEKTLQFVLSYFNIEPFVFGILGDFSNPAWDDRRTAETERAPQVIEAVFRAAVEALAARYGSDPEGWAWSRAAPFVLRHPFGGNWALRSYVNRGPLPTSGGGNTINKHQFMRIGRTEFPVKFGPVLRINLDLADLAGSRMSLPGGQSGRPASKHYDDLLPLYLAGEGVSMDMDPAHIEQRAVGRLLLDPAAGGG